MPRLAYAHGPEPHGDGAEASSLAPLLRAWTLDPFVIGAIALACLLYVRGSVRLHVRAYVADTGRARRLRREDWAFLAGMLALIAALISPLDALSDQLFSAHMGQHEVLMLVAAPLLVLARPWQAYLVASPRRVRAWTVAFMRSRWVVRGWRTVTWPAAAVSLHAFVRWVWHAPLLFDAALRNEWVHGLQHATFFGTAALFWWALLDGRYGRWGYGMSVVFVFVTALHTGALAALITFATRAWYPLHELRTQQHALDALEDQQLAGLLMWIPAGVLLLSVGLALFAAWLGEGERRARRALP